MKHLELYGDYFVDYPAGASLPTLKQFISEAISKMKTVQHEFGNFNEYKYINLICRGGSGAISAAIFATIAPFDWHIRITHIKKRGEQSHACNPAINRNEVNIIIDDFISTGETIREVYAEVCRFSGNPVFPIDFLIVSRGWENIPDSQKPFIPHYLISK